MRTSHQRVLQAFSTTMQACGTKSTLILQKVYGLGVEPGGVHNAITCTPHAQHISRASAHQHGADVRHAHSDRRSAHVGKQRLPLSRMRGHAPFSSLQMTQMSSCLLLDSTMLTAEMRARLVQGQLMLASTAHVGELTHRSGAVPPQMSSCSQVDSTVPTTKMRSVR